LVLLVVWNRGENATTVWHFKQAQKVDKQAEAEQAELGLGNSATYH
jgi:hypothetical protein